MATLTTAERRVEELQDALRVALEPKEGVKKMTRDLAYLCEALDRACEAIYSATLTILRERRVGFVGTVIFMLAVWPKGNCRSRTCSPCRRRARPQRLVGLQHQEDERAVLVCRAHYGRLRKLDGRELTVLERHLIASFRR